MLPLKISTSLVRGPSLICGVVIDNTVDLYNILHATWKFLATILFLSLKSFLSYTTCVFRKMGKVVHQASAAM